MPEISLSAQGKDDVEDAIAQPFLTSPSGCHNFYEVQVNHFAVLVL